MCMTSQKTSSNGLCHRNNQNGAANADCASDILQEDKEGTSHCKNHADPDEDKEPRKAGAGFLIIMFYYFQDALLLHVDTGKVLKSNLPNPWLIQCFETSQTESDSDSLANNCSY